MGTIGGRNRKFEKRTSVAWDDKKKDWLIGRRK